MSAWNQVGFFIGGLIMVAIGGACIADFAYWRIRAERFRGVITGALTDDGKSSTNKTAHKNLFPVVEYTNIEGRTVTGYSNNGSSILINKIPGREVELLVMADDPETIRIKGYVGLTFGLIFLIPGFILWGISIFSYKTTIYSFLIAALFLAYIGHKIFKNILPREEWRTVTEFRKQSREKRQKKRQKMKFLGRDDILQMLRKRDKLLLQWSPLHIIIVAGLLFGGAYFGKSQYELEMVGLGAVGEVVDMESEYNSSSDGSSYTYYAVVTFQNEHGKKIRFRDNFGSSHPNIKRGDIVDVLYDPDNEDRAIIDRGIWNWLIPVVFFAVGILMFFTLIPQYMGAIRRRRCREYMPSNSIRG
jgi:hypothetical protein